MVSIRWCLKKKNGIEIVPQNKNMSDSYIKMAEESINITSGVENSRIWTVTTAYYIFYYSLYSLMLRIGVKCEIHSCSLEFMAVFLKDFYTQKDIEMIAKAFSARIDLQYYADRPVDGEAIEEIKICCKDFYIKTKDILARITETQVGDIQKKLTEEKTKKPQGKAGIEKK